MSGNIKEIIEATCTVRQWKLSSHILHFILALQALLVDTRRTWTGHVIPESYSLEGERKLLKCECLWLLFEQGTLSFVRYISAVPRRRSSSWTHSRYRSRIGVRWSAVVFGCCLADWLLLVVRPQLFKFAVILARKFEEPGRWGTGEGLGQLTL